MAHLIRDIRSMSCVIREVCSPNSTGHVYLYKALIYKLLEKAPRSEGTRTRTHWSPVPVAAGTMAAII